ncbi:DUF3592 domain-containing protein [Uliginosibacterium sp. H3]|uniref:DUF3592 domain-containing protein n=1 Tax=Uliginosibacterium silvisoli TaxID=3114758 RepID=A0ABU6K8S5_9RHOO|nr:DUF3592 domain-containing protein [Uliginosibacterium sp. H3]
MGKDVFRKIVGSIFILVGPYMSYGAATFALKTRNLLENGERTTGVVLYVAHYSRSYYPVFVFEDAQGRKFEVKSPDSSKGYFPGEKVSVVYDPNEPLAGRIVDLASDSNQIFPSLFGGLLFLIGAVLVIFRTRVDENGKWPFLQ